MAWILLHEMNLNPWSASPLNILNLECLARTFLQKARRRRASWRPRSHWHLSPEEVEFAELIRPLHQVLLRQAVPVAWQRQRARIWGLPGGVSRAGRVPP